MIACGVAKPPPKHIPCQKPLRTALYAFAAEAMRLTPGTKNRPPLGSRFVVLSVGAQSVLLAARAPDFKFVVMPCLIVPVLFVNIFSGLNPGDFSNESLMLQADT